MNGSKRKEWKANEKPRVVIYKPEDSRGRFRSHASTSTYTHVSSSVTKSTVCIGLPTPVVNITGIKGYGRDGSGASPSHTISVSSESTRPSRIAHKGNTIVEYNNYYTSATTSALIDTIPNSLNRHDVNYLLNPSSASTHGKIDDIDIQGRESPKSLFRSSRAGAPLTKPYNPDRLLSLAIRQPASFCLNFREIEDDVNHEQAKRLGETELEIPKNEKCQVPSFEADSNFLGGTLTAPNSLLPVDIEDGKMMHIEDPEDPDEQEEEYEDTISVLGKRKRCRSTSISRSSVSYMSPSCPKKQRRRWQFDEQESLRLGVEKYGDTAWDKVSKFMTDMGCNRTPKQCRERYRNHDSSALKNVRIWSQVEDNAIKSLYKLYPKQWARISKDRRLDGRAPVHIRNRFNWKLKGPGM